MTRATITRSDEEPATLSITLDPPVRFKAGEIEQLLLREPTAREVREAERERTAEAAWAGELAYEMRLVAAVAGLAKGAAEALPVMVLNHAAAFLQELIEAGPSEAEAAKAEQDGPPEPVSLPLDPPITFQGVVYAELDLREPLGSEVRNARLLMRSPGDFFESRRAQMALVTAVTGLPAPVIDALPIRTLNEAARVLGRFTIAGRRTGKR